MKKDINLMSMGPQDATFLGNSVRMQITYFKIVRWLQRLGIWFKENLGGMVLYHLL